MSRNVYVSPVGLERLQARVASLEAGLRLLRDEKLTAYTGSGDGWHDNPFFNKLEQDERSTAKELAEVMEQVAHAVIFEPSSRPIDAVRFGSIVEIERSEPGKDDSRELWEIVGYGESDRTARKLAYTAPLASALVGQEPGSVVSFQQPRGAEKVMVNVEILALHAEWP